MVDESDGATGGGFERAEVPPRAGRGPGRPSARFAAVTAAVFVLTFARSVNRSADPDEHQFVAPPALLAAHGLLPYLDYPYFHMPDLVFVVAALTGWTSWKLLAARTISAACGTATVAALFALGWRAMAGVPRPVRWCLVGGPVLVFFTCRLFTYTSGAAWNHDAAVLCLVLAFGAHVRGMRRGRVGLIAAAGLMAGLALGIRLSFALAVVPLAASAGWGESPLSPRRRAVALAAAAGGAALANVPVLWLLAVAPGRVAFGNLGYPALSTAYYRSIHQHGLTVAGKVGSSLSKFLTDPGNLLLLAAFVAVLALSWRPGRRRPDPWRGPFRDEFRLAGGLVVALWVGAMGPTPMMQQYNYALVPFMLLAVLYALATAATGVATGDDTGAGPAGLRRLARGVAIVCLVVGGSGLRWYWWVVRLPRPGTWTPVVQHREGEWVRRLAGPGARVLTMESTVPLEGGLDVVPEYATGRFALLTARFQPPADRRADGMFGPADLPALWARRRPDAVFARVPATVDQPFVAYAAGQGYRRVLSADGRNQLWLRPGL